MNPVRWIRNVLVGRRMRRDLDDEIAQHLEEKTEALIAEGLSTQDAAAAARRAFGSVSGIRDRSGDVWRWRSWDDVAIDVRSAVRQLRRAPSFAAAAVVTLAVGIGANTAVFTLVHAVLIRPLPYPKADDLVSVQLLDHRKGPHPSLLAYFTFFEFRRSGVFERIASYRNTGVTLTRRDLPIHLTGFIVSSDFFDVLGIRPSLGRGFIREDEARDARVVVLGYEVWQTLFGADPGAVGRPVEIDGEPSVVAGVAPPGLAFPFESRPVQIWTTLAMDASAGTDQPMTEQRGARVLDAVARLRPGTTIAQAQSQLDAVARRLGHDYPDSNRNVDATRVESQITRLVGDLRAPLLVLWSAVALVLVIACANLANMLLARTADRAREFSVRVAIGGSPARVVRQLLTENLLIAAIGSALGVGGAFALERLVLALAGEHLPRAADVGLDHAVLAFTAGLAIVSGIVISVLPAAWLRRAEAGGALRADTRGSTTAHEKARGVLVVAQVSIGVLLLSGACLLSAWLLDLTRRDLGFRPEHLLSFDVDLPGYSTAGRAAFLDDLLGRLRTTPGVTSATLGMPLPLTGDQMRMGFNIEERPSVASARPFADMAIVDPAYFRTIGTQLLDGREFTGADDERSPRVLVVNKAFADRFFPGERAVGKRIDSGATSQVDPRGVRVFREIIGVVGNARQNAIGTDADPIYYFPYKQMPWGPPSVIVRTDLPAAGVVPDIRRHVAAIDSRLPVHDVQPMSMLLAENMAGPQLMTLLMSSFAGMGLVLCATGLYGLLAYGVSRRAREIGVRMALGASRRGVVTMILRRAFSLVGLGVVMGGSAAIAGQVAFNRLIVRPAGHPVVWLSAAIAVMALTAVAAVCPPAFHAASIDPASTLRAE